MNSAKESLTNQITGLTSEARNERPWLTAKQPAGYVPGLGRGATGFTTRSDIGPAREVRSADTNEFRFHAGPSMTDATTGMKIDASKHSGEQSARIRLRQRQEEEAAMEEEEDKDDAADNSELNESHYDKTFGYNKVLFKKTNDVDDVEADRVYDAIDERQDQRRRIQRERREQEELESYRKKRPKIQQMFSDLKHHLKDIDETTWMAIPEVGDYKNKKQRSEHLAFIYDRITATPDTILLGNLSKSQKTTSANQGAIVEGDNLTNVRKAKTTMLNSKLNSAGDSVTGQTAVDPKGYITEMQSVIPAMATSNIQDVKKGRQLLKSVRETNPGHAPAWIASARIEEAVGEVQKARNLITLGCEKCPRNEDVWLEAARLQEGETAKKVCAAAIQRLPKSVKIWTRAAQLETDSKAKRRVFRRALEHAPESVQLWKQAVNLEKPTDARIMLSRAVECCPTSQELWLALARLESYENARKVLNKARKHIPTERQIWIAAAQLEESNNETDKMESMIEKVIARSISSLQTNGVEIYREHWLDEAKKCEREKFPITCGAIVRNVIGVGIEEQDHENTWMGDIRSCLSDELAEMSVHTARSIYAHALSLYPNNHTFWEEAAYFEQKHGTADQLEDLLEQAVRVCPKNENFWLMAAKSKWKSKQNIGMARKILASAFKVNPNSEKIWLAAVKLEQENNEPIRARKLLAKARDKADTPRVWMTSVKLEWQLDNMVEALDLVKQSIKKYSRFFKLYLMYGQMLEQLSDREKAHDIYMDGVKNCPTCSELWIYLARNQKITHSIGKARATLEKALVKNKVDTKIWRELVELELKEVGKEPAQQVLARAQQAVRKVQQN